MIIDFSKTDCQVINLALDKGFLTHRLIVVAQFRSPF